MKYSIAKRAIKIADRLYILLIFVLVSSTFALSYKAYDDGSIRNVIELISEPTEVVDDFIPQVCNKRVYKARLDCRKLLVDNHWEKWKENRDMIKVYCDAIATEMYCEPI